MKTTKHLAWTLLLLVGCAEKTDASRANFTAGLTAYLARRGDLCVGRASWPIDVGVDPDSARTRDGVQLPVLQRLGLVEATRVTLADGHLEATRYRLTAAGRA